MNRLTMLVGCFGLALLPSCATQKESFTPRTGVEQMLISSAVDKSLDNLDFAPLRGKQVYLETKYLDCVDKNYVLLALRHRMLIAGAALPEKADKADVIVEVASGAVGTDAQELFIGIPEIPLPPPSPIAIPRVSFLTRSKLNGTAKILVVAYDAKTKRPILPTGMTLARSDQNNWNVMGMGPVQTGSLPTEIAATTKEKDLSVTTTFNMATGAYDAPPPRFYARPVTAAAPAGPIATPGTPVAVPGPNPLVQTDFLNLGR
jgi:hypothetical protein